MQFNTWESYFYPDTYDPETGQGTLRNLFNERDRHVLRHLEYAESLARQYELVTNEVKIPRTYDHAHLKAIHRHLFQNVYPWAGKWRRVNISKGYSFFADANTGQIDRYLADAHRLIDATRWPQLSRERFARTIATVFAYLNQAHPFREGNGRANKVFLEHVAQLSAFTFDFSKVTPRQWNMASALSGPDLGEYEPVPQSLIPVFEAITEARCPQQRAADKVVNAAHPHPIAQQLETPYAASIIDNTPKWTSIARKQDRPTKL